jgi:hypothetical protein
MTAQLWNIAEFNGRRERCHLNPIDNAVWSAGQWASTLQSETGPYLHEATGQRFMFVKVTFGRSAC